MTPAVVREALAGLAAADARRRRFGAAAHAYRLRAPLTVARVAALEAAHGVRFPDDYRAFVAEVGDGGAGPGYGLVPLDHPRQQALLAGPCPLPTVAARVDGNPWRGVVALAHLGCGQLALLVVDGPARGTVWIDARAVGAGVVPAADGFAAFFLDWLERAARGVGPRHPVPAATCTLPAALSGYLAQRELEAGVEPGSLAGAALREVLAAIPAGGVALAATGDDPIFARGAGLDPCITCCQLVETLGADGLAGDVVRPGSSALAAEG
ncbi:MAG: SMI1/KNR4 family protein [Kofleriaceae bacterium]